MRTADARQSERLCGAAGNAHEGTSLLATSRAAHSRISENAKRALIAYALFVRAQMNDQDAACARWLIAEAKR